MHRTKLVRTVNALMLTGALLLSMTSCASDKQDDQSEQTEQTQEQKPSETTAQITAVETAVETAQASETSYAVDTSSNDARYSAFFENEYPEYDERLYLSANGINVLYAYADLDNNGSDELLIGDPLGVYLVVTEVDGTYNVSEIYGWIIQYGAEPVEYIGNGCFLCSVYNGNNYGGEFCIDALWRYDTELEGLGILARISGSWDPDNLTDNLSKWELYIADDENAGLSTDLYSFTQDIPGYTYSMIDYGDNYQFVDGERAYNELEQQFYDYVDSHRTEDTLTELNWMPVS